MCGPEHERGFGVSCNATTTTRRGARRAQPDMSSSPAWPLDPAAVGGDGGDDGERDAAGELLEPLAADDDAAAPDASAPSAIPSAATASLTDEELALLVARVMDQDERALAVLYEQLSGQVYALCLRITGEVGRAEEVLEDVFWQVWRQAPRFCASRGNVRAWVMTMARSRAIDAARSRRRDREFWDSRELSELGEALDSEQAGPQDLLAAAQEGSRLHQALLGLDPVRRQVVSLSFFRGMTQLEIAEHTGMPLGTVKSHLRRSLIALGQALGAPPQADPT
jgi:RNA polymerase sigma factor (sigma-70 family)|mmetsp:Transcript_23366/g.55542  ORF Transcript_23366/g.55542 Transcript_23366/m.55542 type:complete len:281 (-) Transcript_23366:348-1190(-)